jgi:hypothetical protein
MPSEVEKSLSINDEARMSKPEGIPNVQMTKADAIFPNSGFVIPSSFVIRHLDFVIRLIFYDYEHEHRKDRKIPLGF